MHQKDWLETNGRSLSREETLTHLWHHWGIEEGSRYLRASDTAPNPNAAELRTLEFNGSAYELMKLHKVWDDGAGAFTESGIDNRGRCYVGSGDSGIFCFFLGGIINLEVL